MSEPLLPHLTTQDGAFMEPRGCNRWQLAANGIGAVVAGILAHWLRDREDLDPQPLAQHLLAVPPNTRCARESSSCARASPIRVMAPALSNVVTGAPLDRGVRTCSAIVALIKR